MTRPLRIGTRGSPLALVQARMVRDRLAAAHPGRPAPEIVPMRTTGDAVQDRPLAEIGGKGLFTKEIEQALLVDAIDLAVHSLKDMETYLPDGLVIDCVLERADPRDALIGVAAIAALPAGARFGTSSLRRAAQIRALRPDVAIAPLRGNVDTRLARVAEGAVAATLLAVAGLARLGRTDAIAAILEPAEMLPAAAQGAIAIERRAGDDRTAALLAPLNHAPTLACVTAERALLAALDGSCRTPIGALATLDNRRMTLDALVAAPDGAAVWRTRRDGPAADAVAMGVDAGAELRRRAGDAVFADAG
ncbi:MAG: hydroxymethylbilane synthase [Alphaproteobacteria bacterium]